MNVGNESRQVRILGRVEPAEFIGREAELSRIVAFPNVNHARGLLILIAPAAGVSELLRQSYDAIFHKRGRSVPIYFSFPRETPGSVSLATDFLRTVLRQYLAFRLYEPALSNSALTLHELLELAPPADVNALRQIIANYDLLRGGHDDSSFVAWCLSVPQKLSTSDLRPFVIIDGVPFSDRESDVDVTFLRALEKSGLPYAVAGLRRYLLEAAYVAGIEPESLDTMRLERLSDEESRLLAEKLARRVNVSLGEATRDLIVQQFDGSPLFMSLLMNAAREKSVALTSYLACERLYADELLGGTIGRYYSAFLEKIAPDPRAQQVLIQQLAGMSGSNRAKSTFAAWQNQTQLDAQELRRILLALHIQEFITWNGTVIGGGCGPLAWHDFVTSRYRLDVATEARALVAANTITSALKRAPRTMARHYRRAAASGLRELLDRFDCQLVPLALFDNQRFSSAYKGASVDEVIAGLDQETEQMRLPQVVHTASCVSFSPEIQELCEDERCIIAHSFVDGNYVDTNEQVWFALEIDSKLEAPLDLASAWHGRLARLSREIGARNARFWLIAREGFSEEACEWLREREVFTSSRAQLDYLAARLQETLPSDEASLSGEFEMTVPMGGDNEMIVAHTVEQIARRLNFTPEAINQIKHAVVEACINASEHSLSPDQKIYQRFRAEDDKLVITISSRGIVPNPLARNGGLESASTEVTAKPANRRGLGLSMISKLMDEVEFERVDDGTRLKMTKYLRK